MSSKNTIFLTNDKNEHAYFDCSDQFKNKEGLIKDTITIEFSKSNISIEGEDAEDLIISIHNVDSELYKIFEQIGTLATKEQK